MFNKKKIVKEAMEKFEALPMPDLKVIPIEDIHIAPYQRRIDHGRVRRMTKNFLPKAVGAILVSYRDGKYWCVDGQHRLEASKAKGYKDVCCSIITDLDYMEECLYFTILNTGLAKLGSNQIFTGLVEGNDPKAMALVSMFRKYHFDFNRNSSTSGNNLIGCVKTFEKIRDDHGMYMVERILRILRNTWFGNAESLRASVVTGLKTFLNEHFSADETILVSCLEKHYPKTIVDEAKRRYGSSLMDITSHRDKNCYHVAKIIEHLYDEAVYTLNNPVKRGRPRKDVV